MTRHGSRYEYFTWLSKLVCENRFHGSMSYDKLLTYLHNTPFRYYLPLDENRAADGEDLRWRWASENGLRDVPASLNGPCSVLEMMIALVLRCDETFMDDPELPSRAGQWFWGMVVNLGLGSMSDDRYDQKLVEEAVERLLNREYEPDGRGGLFRIRDCARDMRTMEIWHQLCWYLDSIT